MRSISKIFKLFALFILISGVSFYVKSIFDFGILNAKQAKHPTGLVVSMPQNYIAKKRSRGFVVEPKNNNLRIPISISVNVSESMPLSSTPEEKRILRKLIYYYLVKSDGGSGGDNYEITAYEFVDENTIIYFQNTQSEASEPNFDLFWKIVANTQYKP